ncbi:MAG: DUF2335 domain-containing protein [Vampirovibrionales bacterium]|nr:DUF2335 domain-containing protein [Vampirovibrionales bacterium]
MDNLTDTSIHAPEETAAHTADSVPSIMLEHRRERYVFSGPTPPPELLKAYESIQPGFADRLMQHAEREQAHRHQTDIEMIDLEKNHLKCLMLSDV